MKTVLVGDFVKRLLADGVSLNGCQIINRSSSSTYFFNKIDEGNVQVLYGENLNRMGHLYKFLKVDSVEVLQHPGDRLIRGTVKGLISIKVSEDLSRGW